MGLQKDLIHQGASHERARYGDTVTVVYSGHIYDAQKVHNDYHGKQYVAKYYAKFVHNFTRTRFSSRNDQPFTTIIKENLVVEGMNAFATKSSPMLTLSLGWIDGITKLDGGMKLGERAVFVMSHDWAYGEM
jgi:FKBP-type peptidyl-prolyl cis-trans isomerase